MIQTRKRKSRIPFQGTGSDIRRISRGKPTPQRPASKSRKAPWRGLNTRLCPVRPTWCGARPSKTDFGRTNYPQTSFRRQNGLSTDKISATPTTTIQRKAYDRAERQEEDTCSTQKPRRCPPPVSLPAASMAIIAQSCRHEDSPVLRMSRCFLLMI